MKVKLAAQVLSHSVAAGMYSKIATGDMPSDATPTANLIAKMDMLFDSVNAYTPDLRRGKKFSSNIKERTEHIALFREIKVIFKNLVFLECRSQPPSKEGWIWTLNGLVWPYRSTKHKSVKSLSTRRIQQVPLENLFSVQKKAIFCYTLNTPPIARLKIFPLEQRYSSRLFFFCAQKIVL